MKVLSLFDGMACGAIAFTKLGIPIDRYVAYEIDKYAVKVASHNFPFIEQRGDVFQADFTEFEGFDWLIGGSPCTYWSIAQKNNRETEASGLGWELFSQYVRALHEAKPKYFIYENNKSMSKEIKASITEAFGFEPVLINSALVSAQNRQRLYWVGKREPDGTYSKVDVQQPEDRGILLRDVLDSGFDPTSNEKAYCLTKSYNPCVWNTIERSQRNMVAEPVDFTDRLESSCWRITKKAQSGDAKSRTLTASSWKGVESDGMPVVAEPVRIGTIESEAQNTDHDSKQYRVYSPDGKSTTICGQGGGVGAKTGLYAVPYEYIDYTPREKSHIVINENAIRCAQDKNNASAAESFVNFADRKIGTVTTAHVPKCIEEAEKHPKAQPVYEVRNGLITIKDKQYPIKLADGYYIIRKLTVNECKRLQTVPEWYDFSVISNTRAYKCLGNGWTCEVIIHLITSAIKKPPSKRQLWRER